MKKFFSIFCIGGLGMLCFQYVFAQEQGIGVSPARIEKDDIAEWPYAKTLLVTNYSDEKELYEVATKTINRTISVNPGRFVLNPGETGRVMASFEKPAQGVFQISAVKTSAEGFATGTGIEAPFSVSGNDMSMVSQDASQFAAGSAAVNFSSSGFVIGSGILLFLIFVLWKISRRVGLLVEKIYGSK
ncbi:MAG: hypothetical protein A3E07_01720 [Candidatus Wildermuthbacteria bacterium RIFCSPHIGHO2_12_FULL_45_9]|nr:MAG: hypothetical protein A3E07_01720 [Candidatus Wildermuthbacteria bacterium RIFCSPHIGHO2_12_FULL_45_9]